MSSSRLCSLSVWIMSVDCKNTRQAVVVKWSKEINHTAFKYMQVKYTQDYWLHSYDVDRLFTNMKVFFLLNMNTIYILWAFVIIHYKETMYFYMLKISLWQSCNLRSGIDRHFTWKFVQIMYLCILRSRKAFLTN